MGCPSICELGANLVFSVTTHDADTGVATDASSVPSYRLYEDENATPILTGNMAKLDDANTTGLYTESIAVTSANGFEDGKTYTISIMATVDSDIGGISYSFKAYTQIKANVMAIDADVITATSIQANAITASKIAAAAIDNATFAADVGSTAYADNIIALAVRKVLDVLKLDHLVAVADTDDPVNNSIFAKLAAVGGDWSTFVPADDSLQAIRDRGDSTWAGSPPTIMQSTTIATLASQTSFTLAAGSSDNDAYNDAFALVVDQTTGAQQCICDITDYVGATKTVTLGSDPGIFTMATGDTIYIIAAAPGTAAPTAAQNRAEMDSNSTQFTAIVGDTNALQTDWANGGRLDLLIDAIKAVTDVIPDSGALTTIGTDTARLTAVRAAILTDWINGGRLDLLLDAIPTTAMRGTDSASTHNAAAVKTAVEAAGSSLALILADTGTDGVKIAADQPVDVTKISGDATAANNLESYCDGTTPQPVNVTQISGDATAADNLESYCDGTDNQPVDVKEIDSVSAAAVRLALAAGQMIPGTVDTVVNGHTPTTTEFQCDDITEATADHFIGRSVVFTSGALAGQATDITDYAVVGGIGQFTVTALTEAPANNATMLIV